MTTRCAIYCRVSTANRSQTTENQKRDLLRYAESREWEVTQVYEDSISGAKDSRQALDQMMKAVRQGKADKPDVVLVWRVDRFARSVRYLMDALEEFRSLGVDFVSQTEGIDTSSAMGKLIFVFLAGIAKFERSVMRDRVKLGIQRAQQDGVHCGRPRVGFDVNTAVKLQRDGLSWKKLSRQMGVSVSTLRRTLPPLVSQP